MKKTVKKEEPTFTLVGYTVVTHEGLSALKQELLKGILNVSLKKDDVIANLNKKSLNENMRKKLVIVEIKADKTQIEVFNEKDGKISVKGKYKTGKIYPYEEAPNEIGVTPELANVA